MDKVVTDKVDSYAAAYPRIACVVTVTAGGKDNAMTAVWHSPLSIVPPLFGVSIAAQRCTYSLIAQSREFAVNFLPLEKVEIIAGIGGCSGQNVDKFQKFSLTKDKSAKTSAPILQEAYAAYECKLVDHRTYGDHKWVVGEVVAVHVREGIFAPSMTLDLSKVTPALFMGKEFYLAADPQKMRFADRKVYGK